MEIKQFYDKALAHASYAVLSNGEIILIDPGRDPKPYCDFAECRVARIVGIIETHPHADFVSSHKEISDTMGCPVYVSKLVGAEYHHKPFDEGDKIKLGKLTLRAINTPGHSPDSICVVVSDEEGKEHAIFTGDTLFVGDVGRPDLREEAGSITAQREELAREMFRSTREKLMLLPSHLAVYPAHGAGSLCGKSLSTDTSSTIYRELRENYALQKMTEDEFVDLLLQDQPYVPKYFPSSVAINRVGARSLDEALSEIPHLLDAGQVETGVLIVDSRPADVFARGYLKNSINIPLKGRFETYLGSVIAPGERFYLLAAAADEGESALRRIAKIGYETQVAAMVIADPQGPLSLKSLDEEQFERNPDAFTIVDVRRESEYAQGRPFHNSINIPLHTLRERLNEIPRSKPIVVHCRTNNRAPVAASIIALKVKRAPVHNLGESVSKFRPVEGAFA